MTAPRWRVAPLSPAQVANLKALQVHTVEQLANITDARPFRRSGWARGI